MSGFTRRRLLESAGGLAALTALGTLDGPLRWADAQAQASGGGLSDAGLATFTAVVEAICSFDGKGPPPGRIRGRRQPGAHDAARRFDAEYRAQVAGFRQAVDLVLAFTEEAPRTPPPLGAVTAQDLVAYGGKTFTQLEIPLRLRLLRSWQADHNRTPLDPPLVEATGIPDYGTLHRAVAYGATQLSTLFYYFDRRTWPPLGWTGPWLGRSHHGEDLPFSHGEHRRYTVRYGGGVVA